MLDVRARANATAAARSPRRAAAPNLAAAPSGRRCSTATARAAAPASDCCSSGQQGAAGRELLAGDRALRRVERGAYRRNARAVQRGSQGDDLARPTLAAVIDVPEPRHDAARRVADHGDRPGSRTDGPVHVSVEHASLQRSGRPCRRPPAGTTTAVRPVIRIRVASWSSEPVDPPYPGTSSTAPGPASHGFRLAAQPHHPGDDADRDREQADPAEKHPAPWAETSPPAEDGAHTPHNAACRLGGSHGCENFSCAGGTWGANVVPRRRPLLPCVSASPAPVTRVGRGGSLTPSPSCVS